MLRLEVLDKKRRGRPKRRFRDVVREDVWTISVTKQEARLRMKWKDMFCYGNL